MKSGPFHPAHPALGVDCGEVRIGIAATDGFGILAHPVETIERRRADPLERIAALAAIRGIRTIVVGLPLRMDGSEGSAAAKARSFAAKIRERLPLIPVVMTDETHSTADAAAKLREAGRNARNSKHLIDRMAAVEILHSWMRQESPDSSFPFPEAPPPDIPDA
jgi:putative Holliday junction resolvase